ncbi:MAG: undecaprenyl-diphosphate phosphatase [Alphaproteobacteria bacterium]
MLTTELVDALLLGIVEGLTEFIPVSSTGHLILVGELLGFEGPPGFVFEVVIQLGAVLAVCMVYASRLAGVAADYRRSAEARRFVWAVVLAFMPAACIGVFAHGFIKEVLFSPYVVCFALITGGIAILIIERNLPTARVFAVEGMPLRTALGIGVFQTLAMIPGVSRSGATILGALLLGVDRKTAAEFSFFLAIPTMFGAVVYDLYKNRDVISIDGTITIAVGFVAAFFAGLVVVRSLLAFIGRYGFTPFGWYRIAVGVTMLAILTWW